MIKKEETLKRKTIRYFLVGAILSVMFFAKAYETILGEKPIYEDIDLSLTDTRTGHLQFNTLEKVLEYTNSEEQQNDGETEVVNVYPKEGGWKLEAGNLRTFITLYGNQIWKGVNPAVEPQPLTLNLEIKPFDEKGKSRIVNGIILYKGASLEQLVFKDDFGVTARDGESYVKNCYFNTISRPLGTGVDLKGDVLIEGNTLEGKGSGVGVSLGANETYKTILRNNTIYNFTEGLFSSDIALIDLGKEGDRGDNSFVSNGKNLVTYKTPDTIPAQYNLWTSPKSAETGRATILTTEQEIRDTIEVITLPTPTIEVAESNTGTINETSEDVEVVPFLTRLPFYPITKAKFWRMYE